MKITLKKLHMENFKKVKDQTIEFGHITRIKGKNEAGKTTVVDAFMWCLFNKDSKGNTDFAIRPLDVSGKKIDHIEIKVELLLDADGREYQITKVQKQNWVKKRGSLDVTLQGNVNSYEIDGIPKKEKDYKAFVADIIDEDLFQLLTNPQAFVNKSWKEQRAELMKMIPAVDNDMVIAADPEVLSELNLALSLHTPEDLQAKSKKALSEYKKKQVEIPARIDEVRKSMSDIDTAELELQKNDLKEKIAAAEKAEDDMAEQYEAFQRQTDHVMDLKFKLTDIERNANEANVKEKNRLNGLRMKLESEIEKSKSVLKVLYGNKEDIAGTISAYEKKRLEALDEWKKINAECYLDDSVYDEKDDLCPTCHQKLPDEQIANKHQMFEAAKKERKQKWQADHEDRLERIIKNGKHYQSLITSMKEKQESNVWEISEEEKNLHAREDELVKIENDIAALPDHVDLSGNKEYQHLVSEIAEKEKALQQINSGAEMRQQLKIRKTGLKDELAIVEKQIMAADNGDKEERIEQLEAEMREIAQNVADEEKMLYLLEQFMKAKMMIISKMVNEKFGIVSWKLFDKQVNGAVVECCECTYKGVGINKDLNNGHRVVAGLDIIRTLSKLHNVYAPIFVDNAEAVNDFNYPGMETQMILLKVSEDDELKVEREEM